ncbi:hypothetical protein EVJ58_g606 [Rhodofomes roseus]|uniref:Alpha-type protein kinase domain-containing protein n=1 Tax=Rhodofomes roseus TaxID=34475 RepID=A0A4Y9Z4Z0_9APHY|nr:hypothetical protein EVJ58_g606 [Rhodofomes roseus]
MHGVRHPATPYFTAQNPDVPGQMANHGGRIRSVYGLRSDVLNAAGSHLYSPASLTVSQPYLRLRVQKPAAGTTLASDPPVSQVASGHGAPEPASAVLASAPPVAMRSYSRALHEDYAKPWVEAHRQKLVRVEKVEADRRLDTVLANTVGVRLWTKPHTDVFRINLSTRHAGKFVVAEHASLTQVLAQYETGSLIEVWMADDSEWVKQPFDLPIAVSSSQRARVLLRIPGLCDVDCDGLDDEMTATPPATPRKEHRHGRAASMPLSPHGAPAAAPSESSLPVLRLHNASPSQCPDQSRHGVMSKSLLETEHACMQPAVLSEPPAPSLALAEVGRVRSFPYTYTCDMQGPMEKMRGVTRKPAVHFNAAFPGVKWNRSTYYKHRRYYFAACRLNILNTFVQYGRTEKGMWSVLVKHVDELIADDTSETEPEHTVPHTLAHIDRAPDDPSLDRDVDSGRKHIAKLEWFEYHDRSFSSRFSAQTEALIIRVENQPHARGNAKDIYKLVVPGDVHHGRYAAKLFKQPLLDGGVATSHFHGNADVHFREAHRFAFGGDLAALFAVHAEEHNILTYAFSFARSFVLTARGGSPTWAAQSWLEGEQYPVNDSTDNTALIRTLNTFSHWTVSLFHVLYTDFQGVRTPNGAFIVYDCETHTQAI